MESTIDNSGAAAAGAGLGILGMILLGVAGLACFIFWIMAIVKAFQANDTTWGVLSIFINICGLIWLFMNGHKKLGIWWIICIILAIVGWVILFGGALLGASAIETPPIEP